MYALEWWEEFPDWHNMSVSIQLMLAIMRMLVMMMKMMMRRMLMMMRKMMMR